MNVTCRARIPSMTITNAATMDTQASVMSRRYKGRKS